MSEPGVRQLAAELRLPVRAVVAWLQSHAEPVESASSAIPPSAVKRLREVFGGNAKGGGSEGTRRSLVSELCREYREAYVAENPAVEIKRIYKKYSLSHRISLPIARAIVAEDKNRNPEIYRTLREERARTPARRTAEVDGSDGSQRSGHETSSDASHQQRKGLPPLGIRCSSDEIEELGIDLAFRPSSDGDYGYLAWRRDMARRSLNLEGYQSSSSAESEFVLVARVAADERRLVDEVLRNEGDVFADQQIVQRAMGRGSTVESPRWRGGGRGSGKLREVRERSRFLRRALVMTVAQPQQATRLLEMLGELRPQADRVADQIAPLAAAVGRLNDEISAVALLLSSDEESLGRFFARSRNDLQALQAGQFDHLIRSNDAGSGLGGVEIAEADRLAFALLEAGEQLRCFLGNMYSTRRYRGHDVDVRRLKVLEELQRYYGAERCRWFEGAVASAGVDNKYLVLAIRTAAGNDEHAVAISPLAGQHATFVVRANRCVGAWESVLAGTKKEAKRRGARRLVFRGDDPYTEMFLKVKNILESSV